MDKHRSGNDVIAAIATPPGRGGVGIVRVSGPDLETLTRALLGRLPLPRKATLVAFVESDGAMIDEGIALLFPAPASYTGEDVLELQGHGGPIVMQMLLKRCIQLGARLAEPGEFTRRAFLNEKLDLAQAESVADIIDAATETAARCALRSYRGEFSTIIAALLQQLVDLRMMVEAALDFPEEDVDTVDSSNALQCLRDLKQAVERALESGKQGSLLRSGLQIVLVGRPNVGKSSLLNRLSGEDVAIVTSIAGTTRDALRQAIQIDGVPVSIIDTAGLRESTDEIENVGIQRTWEMVGQADLLLIVLEADKGLTADDVALIARFPANRPQLFVYNKTDLASDCSGPTSAIEVYVSAKTGTGLAALRQSLLTAAGWRPGGEDILMARQRHLAALKEAASHLNRAGAVTDNQELFAEELRLAHTQLSHITGEFTADDLLGEIFSKFCIGK